MALVVATLIIGGALDARRRHPDLKPWHQLIPDDVHANEIGDDFTLAEWLRREAGVFAEVDRLEADLPEADRTPVNRYYPASRTNPSRLASNWNRTFELEPDDLRGAAVLVHGLTDSPYSMRALAEFYRGEGFVAIAPRMPGHGTVPAALTRASRAQWLATVDVAMAEARRRAGNLPVRVVGYSNGGALTLLHELRRLERGESPDVDSIVLLSPMIEVDANARYIGLAGVPAYFGAWSKAAWLELKPEYNPFKYNSFPIKAARESYLLTRDLRAALVDASAQGRMNKLPPILAFQSVADDTVAASAVVTHVFDRLPANGSELVLYDVNRMRAMAPMLSDAKAAWAVGLLGPTPHNYTLTLVGAQSPDDATLVARTQPARTGNVQVLPTGLRYPDNIYSLSHIALPFPANDPLYGHLPSGAKALQLGGITVRGERATLLVSQDDLGRLSYNPFHAWQAQRLRAALEANN